MLMYTQELLDQPADAVRPRPVFDNPHADSLNGTQVRRELRSRIDTVVEEQGYPGGRSQGNNSAVVRAYLHTLWLYLLIQPTQYRRKPPPVLREIRRRACIPLLIPH
jgi:hypothetical protein